MNYACIALAVGHATSCDACVGSHTSKEKTHILDQASTSPEQILTK